jgi:hypothetical protein
MNLIQDAIAEAHTAVAVGTPIRPEVAETLLTHIEVLEEVVAAFVTPGQIFAFALSRGVVKLDEDEV